MAKPSNSTGFQDQIEFNSLTRLLRHQRQPPTRPPPDGSVWKRRIDFSPRQYKYNSPPRIQNFDCHYRGLSPATDARRRAEDSAMVLSALGTRKWTHAGQTSPPKTRFATVFRIAKPMDVKIQAAKARKMSVYHDPEIFQFRELEDPKYYFKPQWTSRMTPDPQCLRSKRSVLPDRQAYRMKEHCFRDVDPGSFNTHKTPSPKYDPSLLFKKDPYPNTAYEALLGRIEDFLSSSTLTTKQIN